MIVILVKINNLEDPQFWNSKILIQELLQTKIFHNKHSKYLNIGLYVEIKKWAVYKIKMNIKLKVAIKIIWGHQSNQ
jgi:hypothetical protein